jgi:hypothetical protein
MRGRLPNASIQNNSGLPQGPTTPPPPSSKAPDRPDFHRGLGFTRRFARKRREIATGSWRHPRSRRGNENPAQGMGSGAG